MSKPSSPSQTQAADGPADYGWSIPYVDQPLDFWQDLSHRWGGRIEEVYFPLPLKDLASGRPVLPLKRLDEFIDHSRLPKCALINSIVTTEPVDKLAPRTIERLKDLAGRTNLVGVTLVDLRLAAEIRKALPDLKIAASVLMDISRPGQVMFLDGLVDTLVPASSVMRHRPALEQLRRAFPGRIKLIANEACLAGCPWRTQHFFDMGRSVADEATRFEDLVRDKPWLSLTGAADHCRTAPRQLCAHVLAKHPWLRLTGGWVLPQHLSFYDGLVDSFKLAGRIRLRDPDKYHRVLEAYLTGSPLQPHQIGGGPAAPTEPLDVSAEFFRTTLDCDRVCPACGRCREYYRTGGSQ